MQRSIQTSRNKSRPTALEKAHWKIPHLDPNWTKNKRHLILFWKHSTVIGVGGSGTGIMLIIHHWNIYEGNNISFNNNSMGGCTKRLKVLDSEEQERKTSKITQKWQAKHLKTVYILDFTFVNKHTVRILWTLHAVHICVHTNKSKAWDIFIILILHWSTSLSNERKDVRVCACVRMRGKKEANKSWGNEELEQNINILKNDHHQPNLFRNA